MILKIYLYDYNKNVQCQLYAYSKAYIDNELYMKQSIFIAFVLYPCYNLYIPSCKFHLTIAVTYISWGQILIDSCQIQKPWTTCYSISLHLMISRFNVLTRLVCQCCSFFVMDDLNPLPHTTILQQTTLNVVCQKIENLHNWMDNLWQKVENIVAKGEIAHFVPFFFCHHVFKKPSAAG